MYRIMLFIDALLNNIRGFNYSSAVNISDDSIRGYYLVGFLIGITSFTCFYNIILYIKRKKDSYPLYISLLCLLVIVRLFLWSFGITPSYSSKLLNKIIKILISITHFSYLSIFILYLGSLYSNLLSAASLKITKYSLIIFIALLFIFPSNIHFLIYISYQIESMVVMIYVISKLFKACQEDFQGYSLIFISSILLTLKSIYGLINIYILHRDFFFSSFLFLVFLTLQNYLIASKSAKSLNDIETLSESLSHNNSLKDDLITCIYKELKPPMSSIVGLTESIINGVDRLSPDQILDVTLINYSAVHLCKLTDDILDYSKLNSKEITLNCRPINLSRIVDIVILIMKSSQQKGNIVYHNNIKADLPEVFADPNRLQQILNNLLELTLAYTSKGSITFSAEVNGSNVSISIEDNGMGIPAWKLTKLFKKYSPAPANEDSSTNLRLNVAEKLIRLHGGTIHISSSMGIGTKMDFTLPLAEKEHMNSGYSDDKFKELAVSCQIEDFCSRDIKLKQSNYKILIIDSDETSSKILKNYLISEGCFVASVKSGISALEIIDSTPDLDLIILNVFIEGMISYDLCKAVRERKSLYELPILMLSSSLNSQALDLIFEVGGNDFLVKPVDKISLLVRVKTLLQLRHYAAETSELHSQISSSEKKVAVLTEDIIKAKEIDKLKTEFFSNISHELKTPLNVIWASVQLLRNIFSDLPPTEIDIHNYLNIMNQNCLRLLRLISNLIDITKIDGNYMQLELSNQDVVFVIEEIVQSVAEYSKAHGIELVFDTDIEEKLTAIDPEKIERILLNLLSNSIKFTPKGGNILVSLEDCHSFIRIKVSDTGIGIPIDKLSCIFDRFTQVDKSLSRNREGSGIGLSLVKSLVDLHGGSIRAESELSKGSTFTIELPYKLLDSEEKKDASYSLASSATQIDKVNLEFSDIYNW